MKNVHEKVNFPTAGVLGLQLSEDTQKLSQEYVKLLEKEEKDAASEVLTKIKDSYADDVKQKLAQVGLDHHLQVLPIHMTVGEFLFSVFISHIQEPTAPLQKAAFGKKLQDYSILLLKDEFDIPKELESKVKEVMEKDDLWEKTAFNAYVVLKEAGEDSEVEPEQRFYLGLNHAGVAYFQKVLTEIVSHYESE